MNKFKLALSISCKYRQSSSSQTDSETYRLWLEEGGTLKKLPQLPQFSWPIWTSRIWKSWRCIQLNSEVTPNLMLINFCITRVSYSDDRSAYLKFKNLSGSFGIHSNSRGFCHLVICFHDCRCDIPKFYL